MKRKILVAGGGHGGIGAAYVLAKNGLDVTVIEKNSRAAMGHDWTDIFDKKGFTAIGMEIPPRETYTLKENMTFIGPGRTIRLRQNTDPEKLEIQMERKELYRYLIENAESAGVKFIFECEVFAPVMLGSRVVGIETAQGTMYADLVIDACGIQSPLRTSLPEYLGIQNEVLPFEQFFVYRAFYNKAAETEADRFAVELLRDGKLGISWVAAEEDYTDVLIGRLEPIDPEEAERTLAGLRRDYPSIGETKLRGGQFVRIPVRQPLGVLALAVDKPEIHGGVDPVVEPVVRVHVLEDHLLLDRERINKILFYGNCKRYYFFDCPPNSYNNVMRYVHNIALKS